MTVLIKTLNSILKNISANVSNNVNGSQVILNYESARNGSRINEAIGGVTQGFITLNERLSSISLIHTEFDNYGANANFVKLSPAVPSLENQLTPSSPTSDNYEVVSLGTPESINYTLAQYTGKSLDEIQSVLTKVSVEGEISANVVNGIKEIDLSIATSTTQIKGMVNSISAQMSSFIPSLSGKLIDDIILNIDPVIHAELQYWLGTNLIDDKIRHSVLRLLITGKVNDAAYMIQSYTTRTDFDVTSCSKALSRLDIDPSSILESRDNGTVRNTPYIESIEEYESVLCNSNREIEIVLMHYSNTENVGENYHLLIHTNGRVSSPTPLFKNLSYHGSNALHILMVGGDPTPDQITTYDLIVRSTFNMIPGIRFDSYEHYLYENGLDTSGVIPSKFSPGYSAQVIIGAS